MKFSNKLSYILIMLSVVFFSGFCYIYAEKSTDYSVDEVQIQCLFESEQAIIETYSLKVNIEDVPSDMKERVVKEEKVVDTVEIIDEVSQEMLSAEDIVEKDLVYSDNRVDMAEIIAVNSLSNIKVDSLQEEYMLNNKLASRNIEEEIGSGDEIHYQKLYRLFGSDADKKDGRVLYYENDMEARKDMEGFYVMLWDIKEDGTWYQRKQYLMAHYELVDTLKCIFSELLELPEEDRVPIKSVGCYHYREGSSAHTCGAAIDINWEENAEMTIDGVITCGYFWKPGENIYSIKPDSPFVHIFEEYGWTWGGYWTSKKDYMHFSYIDR